MAATTTPDTILARTVALTQRALRAIADSGALIYHDAEAVHQLADGLSPATLREADRLIARILGSYTATRVATEHLVGTPGRHSNAPRPTAEAAEAVAGRLGNVIARLAGERGTAWALQFGHLDVLTRHLDEAEAEINRAEATVAALWPAGPPTDAELTQAVMRAVGVDSASALAPLFDVTPRAAQLWAAGDRQMEGPARQLCRLLVAHPELADDLRE